MVFFIVKWKRSTDGLGKHDVNLLFIHLFFITKLNLEGNSQRNYIYNITNIGDVY
jgi:hypothetical protein